MNKREELKKEFEEHKAAINDDLQYIRTKGKRIALSAVVVGGAFFLSYSIARGISAGRRSKSINDTETYQAVVSAPQAVKKKTGGLVNKVSGILITELAVLLIGLAKKQVVNYLSNLPASDD